MQGNLSCFPEELISKDEVLESLTEKTEHDGEVHSMLKHTFIALHQLLERVTKDYLPGGKYHNLQEDETYVSETASAPKHNKLPERIFGYLDFLLKKRPNVAAITNEAQIMFLFNKTSQYIDALSSEKFEGMLKTIISRSRNELVQTNKERNEERQKILLKNQLEKESKLKAQRERETKRRSDLTSTIIDAGLWQTRSQVNDKMIECDSDNKRHVALKKQIQFRRLMLCQYIPGDKKFSFTRKNDGSNRYTTLPWQEVR